MVVVPGAGLEGEDNYEVVGQPIVIMLYVSLRVNPMEYCICIAKGLLHEEEN